MNQKNNSLLPLLFSLLSVLLLQSPVAKAAEVYPGDVTTGPPEVLFDISVQPIFEQINSAWAISALSAGIVAVLAISYFVWKARRKKILQKISQINETK